MRSTTRRGAPLVVLLLVLLSNLVAVLGQNYYEVLGVPQDADEGVVKRAYRKLSLKYHPGASRERARGRPLADLGPNAAWHPI
jgi:DnaJ-domain-containing protein 1